MYYNRCDNHIFISWACDLAPWARIQCPASLLLALMSRNPGVATRPYHPLVLPSRYELLLSLLVSIALTAAQGPVAAYEALIILSVPIGH